MTKTWTLLEAFASFGAKGANPRWSWSARSDDGKTVVLALWQDEFAFVKEEKKITYHGSGGENDRADLERPGNRERLENLKWARAHCDGIIRIVILIAKDAKAQVKETAECFPNPDMRMKIITLDENTGAFYAESVAP